MVNFMFATIKKMTKNDALRRPPVPSCPSQSRFMGLVCVRCRVEGIVLTPSKYERGSNTLGAANQGSSGIKGNSPRKTPQVSQGVQTLLRSQSLKLLECSRLCMAGGRGIKKVPPHLIRGRAEMWPSKLVDKYKDGDSMPALSSTSPAPRTRW